MLCTGQIARHFGLPWRGGGALNASQTVDAQAAYESLMTLLPTFLAGANFVMHSAGWLEGGLVSCYEKFIVDIELLRELRHEFTPLEIDEASLAFDAHAEVGAGGHFLGAVHTLERFRECFYRPMLSSTENFDRWTKKGARDTTARAGEMWRETLESYEQPPLDDGDPRRAARSTSSAGAPSWATESPRSARPALGDRRSRPSCSAATISAPCSALRVSSASSTPVSRTCSATASRTWSACTTLPPALGDQRQQRGQSAGAVRDAREQPQPPPGVVSWRWATAASSPASTLPPESTITVAPRRAAGAPPASSAATPTAPPPSTTSLERSSSHTIASATRPRRRRPSRRPSADQGQRDLARGA